MSSRVIHKFYEPLVLLKALNQELIDIAEYNDPAQREDIEDPEKLFHVFVYKLAHVCDSIHGKQGRTITSFMVLQKDHNAVVEFRFASNQRTEKELRDTASFVRSLLQHIGVAPDHPSQQGNETQRALLHCVLLFNKARIGHYLQEFQSQAHMCLERCFDIDMDESK